MRTGVLFLGEREYEALVAASRFQKFADIIFVHRNIEVFKRGTEAGRKRARDERAASPVFKIDSVAREAHGILLRDNDGAPDV